MLRSGKLIKDPIHGNILVSPLAMQIIDTPEFKKLAELKQLALVHYVYPSAKHTRFEHSVGVYHLTGKYLEYLERYTPMDERLKELIKISGLVHDIGHGIFSHLFDRKFSADLKVPHHEIRGTEIFRNMVKKYELPFLPDEVDLICLIINGGHAAPLTPCFCRGHSAPISLCDESKESKYSEEKGESRNDVSAPLPLSPLAPFAHSSTASSTFDIPPFVDMQLPYLPTSLPSTSLPSTSLPSTSLPSTSSSTSLPSTSSSTSLPSTSLPFSVQQGGMGAACPHWVFQIVNNQSFELDTDKLDYLLRDAFYTGIPSAVQLDRIFNHCRISESGDIIFHKKIYFQIYDIFMARYRLHKEVYYHKTVLAIEIMVTKYLQLLFSLPMIIDNWRIYSDDILNFAGRRLAECLSTKTILSSEERKILEQCAKIKENIDRRKIPKFICVRQEDKDGRRNEEEDDEDKKEWKEEVLEMEKLVEQGYEIHKQSFTLGFCSNKKINPVKNIWFYENKRSAKNGVRHLEPHKVSKLLTNAAHEDITFYYKWKSND